MPNLAEHLPELRCQFADYSFAITTTWHGWSVVAVRIRQGDGPYMIISSDISELKRYLNGQDRYPQM